MKKNSSLFSLMLLIVIGLSGMQTLAQTKLLPGVQNEAVRFSGGAWETVPKMLIYLPKDYAKSTTKKYALILYFSGNSEKGNGGKDLQKMYYFGSVAGLPAVIHQGNHPFSINRSTGDTTWFIVSSLQLPGHIDPVYLSSWYKTLTDQKNGYGLRVDTNRIYVTGKSQGGGDLNGAITEYKGFVPAAAVAMSPAYVVWKDFQLFARTPMWFFQGDNDYVVGQTGTDSYNRLTANNPEGTYKLTQYSGGHCCWTTFYDPRWKDSQSTRNRPRTDNMSIYDWMLQYSLNSSSPPPPLTSSPLTASAGADRTITLPKDSVILDGAASVGTISTWSWTKKSGPATFKIQTSGSKAYISSLVEGSYVFTLTIKNSSGVTSSDDVAVTVKPAITPNPAGDPAVADAGQDRAITLPKDSVILDGTGCTGTITSWYWSKGSQNPPSTLAQQDSKAILTNLAAGVHEFYLTVNGPDNPWPSSSKVTITVNADKSLPVDVSGPAVANAGTSRTITLPKDSIILDGTGSTGTIDSWYWSKGSLNPPSTLAQQDSKAVVTNLSAGVYEFFLTVNGPYSPWPTSSKVTITVNANKSLPVDVSGPAVANAGTSRTITLPKDSVILDGRKSTGQITSWYWSKGSLNPASKLLQNGSTAILTDLSVGTHEFYLTVDGPNNPWPNSSKVTIIVKGSALKMAATAENNLQTLAGTEEESAVASRSTEVNISNTNELKPFSNNRPALKAYPNPVRDRLYIEIEGVSDLDAVIRIVNINGSTLKTYNYGKQVSPTKVSIDVSDLKNGIYFIQLIQGNQANVVQKIIKF